MTGPDLVLAIAIVVLVAVLDRRVEAFRRARAELSARRPPPRNGQRRPG